MSDALRQHEPPVHGDPVTVFPFGGRKGNPVVGDHAADNETFGGRTLNRRVEIEIYPAAPIVAAAGASVLPATPQ